MNNPVETVPCIVDNPFARESRGDLRRDNVTMKGLRAGDAKGFLVFYYIFGVDDGNSHVGRHAMVLAARRDPSMTSNQNSITGYRLML